LSIYSTPWDDDNSYSDRDGVVEGWEVANMEIALRSNANLTSVQATLTSSKSGVTYQNDDDNNWYGTMNGGDVSYGDGDYLGASTSANLLKASAGFSGSGRMLEASQFYITKLEPGGWPTASGAAAGVNVTPTPTSSQKMFIKNIYINKTSSADGSGWGNEEHPVEFTMQNDQGSYDIISGVNKNIVTLAGKVQRQIRHQKRVMLLHGLASIQWE